MTTILALRHSTDCVRCGDALIAPERSEYVDTDEIRHNWQCSRCGHEFETLDPIPLTALSPDVIEEFLPNLLVA
jgi:DNA-directed RNA polymerase subunit RPC12/RpoP